MRLPRETSLLPSSEADRGAQTAAVHQRRDSLSTNRLGVWDLKIQCYFPPRTRADDIIMGSPTTGINLQNNVGN